MRFLTKITIAAIILIKNNVKIISPKFYNKAQSIENAIWEILLVFPKTIFKGQLRDLLQL